MRHNYRKMCENRVLSLNRQTDTPYSGHYYLDNDGSRWAVFRSNGGDRLSSYLPLSTLFEWLDGYGQALTDTRNTAVSIEVTHG